MVEVINSTALATGALNVSSDILKALSTVLSPVMGIIKAIGIAVLVYIIFLIIKSIYNLKTARRIKRIEEKVNEIDDKLDSITKKKKK